MGLVARQPIEHAALAHEVDQLGAKPIAGGPELLVGNLVDGIPGGGVGRARLEVFPQIPGEQRPHRRSQPGAEVHAVGHVTDRHLVDLAIRIEAGPHLPGDLAVAPAHPVGRAGDAETQLGHAEGLVGGTGMGAAQVEEGFQIETDLGGEGAQGLGDLGPSVAFVARRHGSVGREHGAGTHPLECLRRVDAAGDLGPDQLQGSQ